MPKQRVSSTGWKEQRRFRACELKGQGWKQCDIARALGVSTGAVSQWFGRADRLGQASLEALPHPGRPPELTVDQKRLIPDLLSHGAEAYGFRGDVWTCPRVGKVIAREWGVVYHRSHIARLLKELKWTPQLPVERASQRDEAAIEAWRSEVWFELKKRLNWNGASWFLWMRRAFICCPPECERMPHRVRHRRCESFRRVITCPS